MKFLSAFCPLAIFACTPLQAALVFYVNDPTGFNAAVAAMTGTGTEAWSSAGSVSAQSINDSLSSSIANGPFGNGTIAGLTVQSNTLAGNATTVSPRGTNGLYFAPTGFTGFSGNAQPSNQLSSGTAGDSFDTIYSATGGVKAVSLSAMYYSGNALQPVTGTVQVRVFDDTNSQLGQTNVTNVTDVSEASFFGVVATEGEKIGRINLWAGTTAFSGADNISIYTIPEPSSLMLAALGALAVLRRRR